jgi:Zn-finger nucleic acid-binding protein
MNCPVCRKTMVILELDRVEIDYCTLCQGIWLDSGELELLLKNSDRRDDFLDMFQIETAAGEKKRKCPVCRKKMNKLFLPDFEKDPVSRMERVRIDGCPNQHGIWFDRGELQVILKRGGLQQGDPVFIWLKDVFRTETME